MSALLGINSLSLSVASIFAFAVDGNAFKIFWLRPEDFDIIVQRSKTPFHTFYQPLAKKILMMTRWTTEWPTSLC